MVEVGFGLGSNIGDKAGFVRRAAREIALSGAVEDLRLSSFYRTPPWGPIEQDWFVNACAVGGTKLAPHELLQLCQAVEARLGRERPVRWGPRTIDIDLLYYDALEVDEPGLRLPHPEMLKRAFVLIPLMELRPSLAVEGVRIADALGKLDAGGIVRLD